jgi:hypothetical protein
MASIQPVNCFEQFFAHPDVKIAFQVLEKVTLIVLSVLAAYKNPKLFFPFFGAGVGLGVCMHWNKRVQWPCDQKKNHCHRHDHECGKEGSGGCSQGQLEQWSGQVLPPPVGLAVNAAILYDHIGGHSSTYVPIVGLNAGFWIGCILGDILSSIVQDLAELVNPIVD